jgi:hypothetical protein
MKTLVALVVSLAFIALPLAGVAADKQITDVKELAGSWQGWVESQTGGLERATMIIEQVEATKLRRVPEHRPLESIISMAVSSDTNRRSPLARQRFQRTKERHF